MKSTERLNEKASLTLFSLFTIKEKGGIIKMEEIEI